MTVEQIQQISAADFLKACSLEKLNELHMLLGSDEYAGKLGLRHIRVETPEVKEEKNLIALVRKLQSDLEKDVSNPKIPEKVIDYKMYVVNTIIDFYNFYLWWWSDNDIVMRHHLYWYRKSTDDLEKALAFCKMHNVDTDMLPYYDLAELEYAIKIKAIFLNAPEGWTMTTASNGATVIIDNKPSLWLNLPEDEVSEAIKRGDLTREQITKEIERDMQLAPLLDKYLNVKQDLGIKRRKRSEKTPAEKQRIIELLKAQYLPQTA